MLSELSQFFTENKSFCEVIFKVATPVTIEYRWQQFLETSATGLQLIEEVANYVKQVGEYSSLKEMSLEELRTLQHQLVDIGFDLYKV